jgi:hypothetical protein
MRITLKNVRLGFPNLFRAKAIDADSDPRYSASFIFPPDHPQVPELESAIESAAAEKWGAKAPAILKSLRTANKVCLQDGDTKAQYAGFEGNLFINAAAAGNGPAPTVVDRNRNRLSEADGMVYAGCYVNAVIDVYAQDNSFGKRINATLAGVQFVRDGEAFGGGRPASTDDFEDLGTYEDEEGESPFA